MLCPSCNTPNRDDAKFCKGCGHPLHAQQAAPAEAAAADYAPATSVATQEAPGPVPDTPVAAQEAMEPVPAQMGAGEEEDVSMIPTLILTPEKMAAYHSRRWQQDQQAENGTAAAIADQNQVQAAAAVGSALPDAGAVQPPVSPAASEQAQGTGDIPTMAMNSHAAGDEVPIPPPPPPSSLPEASAPATAEETYAEEQPQQAPDSAAPEAEQSPAPQPGGPQQPQPSAATASDFTMLPIGATVIGRYEVTQVLSASQQEHVYQVIDRQGYQRCWNCGSENNAVGDEFCVDCGASLLNVPYTMHEYSATPGGEGTEANAVDSHVLQGSIANTFVDQGRTYVIEQPQAEHSAFPTGVQLVVASYSDAGEVRRSEPNEDSTLVLLLQRVHESVSTPQGVFIVADGLGGHDNGQIASRMTINIIAERLVRELFADPLKAEKSGEAVHPLDEDALVALFQGAIEDANMALCQKNQQDKTDMGSTITGFMVVGEHAYIINVGDSRTYMVRGKQIYQLTTDHSLVAQLVASGMIEPDDVYTHPQRSQIFRSLGDKPDVQIDLFKQALQPGDILLSCSDGLWEMVRNPQIENILLNAPDPQTACMQLIEAANANGGEDNVSAVVVFVR